MSMTELGAQLSADQQEANVPNGAPCDNPFDIQLPGDPDERKKLIAKIDEWGNAEARKKAEGRLQTQIKKDAKEEFGIDGTAFAKLAKWRFADSFNEDSAKADALQDAFQTLFDGGEPDDRSAIED